MIAMLVRSMCLPAKVIISSSQHPIGLQFKGSSRQQAAMSGRPPSLADSRMRSKDSYTTLKTLVSRSGIGPML